MKQDKMPLLIAFLRERADEPLESTEEAKAQELKELYAELDGIYQGGFRHLYFEISQFLESLSPDVYPSLENWLMAIMAYGEENAPHKEQTNGSIKKLYDHVALESLRLDRMEAVKHLSAETNRIHAEMLESAEIANNQVKEVQNNVSHYHEQSIAILGIFSAVVLAFMGGISFSSAVLQNFACVSIFRLVITMALLGFVICNSIFILLRFILHIVYKDGEKGKFRPGIVPVNIILCLILILTVGAYALGMGRTIDDWGRNLYSSTAETASESK